MILVAEHELNSYREKLGSNKVAINQTITI